MSNHVGDLHFTDGHVEKVARIIIDTMFDKTYIYFLTDTDKKYSVTLPKYASIFISTSIVKAARAYNCKGVLTPTIILKHMRVEVCSSGSESYTVEPSVVKFVQDAYDRTIYIVKSPY